MDAPGYAELHSLSNFSFLRGASHPAELVRRAQALGYRALALTDERSLPEAPGGRLRLIIGAEFSTTGARKLVLLAPSQQAYAQLCRLITLGRRRSPKGTYRLRRADFEDGLGDCLALWVPAPQSAADEAGLARQAAWLRECFPARAWIAIGLHRGPDDAAWLAQLCALGRRSGVALVAGGGGHMHTRARRALQDVL